MNFQSPGFQDCVGYVFDTLFMCTWVFRNIAGWNMQVINETGHHKTPWKNMKKQYIYIYNLESKNQAAGPQGLKKWPNLNVHNEHFWSVIMTNYGWFWSLNSPRCFLTNIRSKLLSQPSTRSFHGTETSFLWRVASPAVRGFPGGTSTFRKSRVLHLPSTLARAVKRMIHREKDGKLLSISTWRMIWKGNNPW